MELKATNISFKYPSSKEYILKDINISLDNTKITGLVGDSGSGKSTLCKILSGYVNKSFFRERISVKSHRTFVVCNIS